jgi:hypothetical protein
MRHAEHWTYLPKYHRELLNRTVSSMADINIQGNLSLSCRTRVSLKTSSCLIFAQMNQVFGCYDLMSILVKHLDWGSLVYFSQLGSAYHKLVLHEIRTRIKIFLSRFIPFGLQNDFWSRLEQTNGTIFGGMVRSIMMAGNEAYYASSPPQIDLIIPSTHLRNDCIETWNGFLSEMGYTVLSKPAPSLRDPFEHCTRMINYYNRPVGTQTPSALVTKKISE